MSLSAIPIALIVPPTNLFLLCLAGVLTGLRRRLGQALLLAGLGGLFLLSLPVVSKALLFSLERGLPLRPPADRPPGGIVILSGDVSRDDGVFAVGALTLEREWAGAALYRRTNLPVLVTGGPVGHGRTTLAGLMASSLVEDFQVPVRWVEAMADDTTENASLSGAMLRKDGVGSVYLVTHAWHMKRALQAFANTGITVTAAPVRMDRLPAGELADFVPRASAWLDSYYALHEWIGYAVAAARLR